MTPQERADLDKLLRKRQANPRRKTAFQERYYDAPGDFVRDCIQFRPGEAPAPYQLDILNAVPKYRRVSPRGMHGIGKTALSAWLIWWFALTRDGYADWKIPITASVWRQVSKFTLPEVHKWARWIDWRAVGRPALKAGDELLTLGLKMQTGEAFAVVSDEPSAIEGAHADEILYILDEAKAIPAPTWEAVEGAFSTGNCYALAISTPGDTGGVFYDIHRRRPGYEDWFVRHVTLQEAINAGRISPDWVAQRRKQWGEGSAVYKNRVLGEFAEGGTDTLIPLSWVEAANERYLALEGAYSGEEARGVDVARFGDDASVIASRIGNTITALETFAQLDTMSVTGQVIMSARSNKAMPINVDVIGIGAGVVDRLREQGYEVTGINAGSSAKDGNGNELTDASGELKFLNMRSYLWWMLRERLDPQNPDPLALPPNDLLTGDLTAPKWGVSSSGKIQVESKDDIRKRIGRSTDYADAVALAVVPSAALRYQPGTITIGYAPDVLQSLFGGYTERERAAMDHWGRPRG